VARGNATSCGHERLCVVSRYCEDSALCIGAHGTALGRSLSKHPLNKTSQREYLDARAYSLSQGLTHCFTFMIIFPSQLDGRLKPAEPQAERAGS
jgi:hypothetical protein